MLGTLKSPVAWSASCTMHIASKIVYVKHEKLLIGREHKSGYSDKVATVLFTTPNNNFRLNLLDPQQ